MVQGLAFLSKKSWHTKNLANQEKVWMAEQQKAAEESKTKELAKQIQQEREQEELDRIAGRKGHRKDRGIDWMYQGGTGEAAQEDARKKAEEYLLGKEYVPEGKVGGDFAGFETGGVNSVVVTATSAPTPVQAREIQEVAAVEPIPGSFQAQPSVADRNETFRLQHEDPMFLVSQKQREKQVQHYKKRALYERVVGPTEARGQKDAEDESDRLSRKERKRERKHRRRHRDEHGRRRRRSPSRERSHKDDRRKRRRSHHSRSRSQSEERPRRHDGSARFARSHADDSPDRYGRRDRSRSRSRERSRRYLRSESPEERIRNIGRSDDEGRKPSPPRKSAASSYRPGYGLQAKHSSTSSIMPHRGDLGPNRQLIEQKRKAKDASRRQAREMASNRRRMTDGERAEALRAMQMDATVRDEALNHAVASKKRDHDEIHSATNGNKSAVFLQDMAEKTHGVREGSTSMASRVAQRRHTNQDLNDGFL